METVRAEPEGNKQSLTREAENKGPGQRGVCVVSRRTVAVRHPRRVRFIVAVRGAAS